ncbi:MAG: hypothetical protein BJ554DRAFT_6546 [Olpidium bornovanus]|uniref:ATP-dependent RNA helicase DHX29 DSRM-like domain-containing protein n=1 Tax=Olpidium bornovanus TaxID=278681 RepID=A0A8H7ZYE1_9FUNG|nr:MAG: hypothetical protein BJ554DRAFT_6546 [Olpidium bornovanus]
MGKKPPRQQQGQNSSSAAAAGGGPKSNASGAGGTPGLGGEGKKGGGGGDRSGDIRLGPDGKPVQEKPASLFGSWTGKTPLGLLHEFCQKQKWNKPGIQPRRVENGFVTTIHLSKRTKTGEVLNVRFTPPDRTGPSAALANHWAATYALHRVNSRVSMHHALPPEHRDYWQTLEKARKEEGQAGEWKYAADPFTAKPPPPPARGEGGRRPQRSASPSGPGGPGRWGTGGSGERTLANGGEPADRSAQEAAAAREKRHWEALPMGHMSAETRQLVEQVVRDFFREAPPEDVRFLSFFFPLISSGFCAAAETRLASRQRLLAGTGTLTPSPGNSSPSQLYRRRTTRGKLFLASLSITICGTT